MKIIETRGQYSIRDERHVRGEDVFSYGAITIWGPDVNGRICRMGSYRDDLGRARQALTTLAGPATPINL